MKPTLALFAALLLAPLARPCAAGAPVNKPNLLVIICDDLNDFVGHLGGHPQPRRPHMDALAQSGVSFRRAAAEMGARLHAIAPHAGGHHADARHRG